MNIFGAAKRAAKKTIGNIPVVGPVAEKAATTTYRKIADPNVDLIPSINNPFNDPRPAAKPVAKVGPGILARPAANAAAAAADQGVATSGLYKGGAGADYDPDEDPAKIAAARQRVNSIRDIFQQAFAAAVSEIDALARDKRNTNKQKYGEQRGGLTEDFTRTAQTLDNQFSARNTYNSSDRAVEQGTAENAYKSAMSGLERAEMEDEAEIGRSAESAKAELAADTPDYNVNDYNSVSDLLSIEQDAQKAVRGLTASRAKLGTTEGLVGRLNQIAPEQQTGSAELKAQLDRLANANVNPETKRFLAQSAIDDAGEDAQFYMDYFDRILQGQGSEAVSV